MKIWLVFILQTGPAGEHVCRWIDSMWADVNHARDRAVEIRDSLKACGGVRHEVFYTTATVADAAIQSPAPQQESDPGTQGGQKDA